MGNSVNSYVSSAVLKNGNLQLYVDIYDLPYGELIEIAGEAIQSNGFNTHFDSGQKVPDDDSELLVSFPPNGELDPNADLRVNIRVIVNKQVVQAWPNTLIPTASATAWTIGTLTRIVYAISRGLGAVSSKLDHYIKK
jgi:hypothetical protein